MLPFRVGFSCTTSSTRTSQRSHAPRFWHHREHSGTGGEVSGSSTDLRIGLPGGVFCAIFLIFGLSASDKTAQTSARRICSGCPVSSEQSLTRLDGTQSMFGCWSFPVPRRTFAMKPTRALHLAFLALQLNVVASQLGHAQFTDVQQTIFESSKFAVLSLARIGGVSGELEARVYVTKATPTADFFFENTTVRWADGDSSLKPVTVRVLDDTVFEPNEAIWFAVNDTNLDPAPNSSLRTTQVRLLPDGDGGLLRFTFVPPGATQSVNLVSYVATVEESFQGLRRPMSRSLEL
eukprot:s240_g11.t1